MRLGVWDRLAGMLPASAEVVTNAAWAMSQAAIEPIMTAAPHNTSSSDGGDGIVDTALLSQALGLMAKATELVEAAGDPETAPHLSALLIEIGKFQLLLDNNGHPPLDADSDTTGNALAWFQKAQEFT